MVDGATTAPPLLQEADLIGLMEKHGIGMYIHTYIHIYIQADMQTHTHTY